MQLLNNVFQRVNWPSPLRWRSCRRPCSLTTSLIPGPSWPTPPPTAWLYGVCVCVLLFIFCVQKADIRSPKMFFFLFVCVRYNDVLQRCKELDSWTQDLSLPSVVWLSGLFNPQSFLTGNTHSCMQPTKKSFKILIIYLLHHHSSTLTLQR